MLDRVRGLGRDVHPALPPGVVLRRATESDAIAFAPSLPVELAASAVARSGMPPLVALAYSIAASDSYAFSTLCGHPLALLGCHEHAPGVGEAWLALGLPVRHLRRTILALTLQQLAVWHARWPVLIGVAWHGAPAHGAYLRHLGFTKGFTKVYAGNGIFSTYVRVA